MKYHPKVHGLYGPALLAAAVVLCTSTATAQGIAADRINTTLSLGGLDYPVTITHVYEGGRASATYYADGAYTQGPTRGLGKLVSVQVFAGLVAHGIIDTETTPGTGRAVSVSFTSATEADGSKSGIIIVDVVY